MEGIALLLYKLLTFPCPRQPSTNRRRGRSAYRRGSQTTSTGDRTVRRKRGRRKGRGTGDDEWCVCVAARAPVAGQQSSPARRGAGPDRRKSLGFDWQDVAHQQLRRPGRRTLFAGAGVPGPQSRLLAFSRKQHGHRRWRRRRRKLRHAVDVAGRFRLCR